PIEFVMTEAHTLPTQTDVKGQPLRPAIVVLKEAGKIRGDEVSRRIAEGRLNRRHAALQEILERRESITGSRGCGGGKRSSDRKVVEAIQLILNSLAAKPHCVPASGPGKSIDHVKGIRHCSTVIVDSRTEREQSADSELINARELCAIAALRANVLKVDEIGGNVGEQETAKTKTKLIDLRGAEIMGFRQRKEAVPLSVSARE